jgi:hypothetical protein
MSVDFDLFVKSKRVAHFKRAACFYSLGNENGVYEQDTSVKLSNSVDGVLYKVIPDTRIRLKEAVKWLKTVQHDLGLKDYFPEQSVRDILTVGFFVDGNKVSGPLMNGTLCFIRCLEEEPDIVITFNKLLNIKGMDTVTALVLAHGLRWDQDWGWFVYSFPRNNNHTAYVGKITADTLKEAWNKVWLDADKNLQRWANHRNIRGVFDMFAPKGNKYVEKTLLSNLKACTPKEMQNFCENNIFPLRQAHFSVTK